MKDMALGARRRAMHTHSQPADLHVRQIALEHASPSLSGVPRPQKALTSPPADSPTPTCSSDQAFCMTIPPSSPQPAPTHAKHSERCQHLEGAQLPWLATAPCPDMSNCAAAVASGPSKAGPLTRQSRPACWSAPRSRPSSSSHTPPPTAARSCTPPAEGAAAAAAASHSLGCCFCRWSGAQCGPCRPLAHTIPGQRFIKHVAAAAT